jgi:hypothetical protein
MIHERRDPKSTGPFVASTGNAFDNLHEWVLSLPWVVERPCGVGAPAVRSFAVDCEPLGRKRLWLVTGMRRASTPGVLDVAVILPIEAALAAENAGLGRCSVPMPAGYMLLRAVDGTLRRPLALEALVLAAYSHAMSS